MEYYGKMTFFNMPENFFSLVVNGKLYNFRQLWNPIGFWTLSIMDANKKNVVDGVKLISGIYIFAQYPEIDFDMIFNYKNDPERDTLKDMQAEIYLK